MSNNKKLYVSYTNKIVFHTITKNSPELTDCAKVLSMIDQIHKLYYTDIVEDVDEHDYTKEDVAVEDILQQVKLKMTTQQYQILINEVLARKYGYRKRECCIS